MLINAGFLNDRIVGDSRFFFLFPNMEDDFHICQHSLFYKESARNGRLEKSSGRGALPCVRGRMEWKQAVVNSFGLKCIRFSYTSCCQNASAGIKMHGNKNVWIQIEDLLENLTFLGADFVIFKSAAPEVK